MRRRSFFFCVGFSIIQCGSLCTHRIVSEESELELFTDAEENIAFLILFDVNGTRSNTQRGGNDIQLFQRSDLFNISYDTSSRFWILSRTRCLAAGYSEMLEFQLHPQFGDDCINETVQVTVLPMEPIISNVPAFMNVEVCTTENEIDILNLMFEEGSNCTYFDCSVTPTELFRVTGRNIKASVSNIEFGIAYRCSLACVETGNFTDKQNDTGDFNLTITFSEAFQCLTAHSRASRTEDWTEMSMTMLTNSYMTNGVQMLPIQSSMIPSCDVKQLGIDAFFDDPIKVILVFMVAGIVIGAGLAVTVYCLIQKWCFCASFTAAGASNGEDERVPEQD